MRTTLAVSFLALASLAAPVAAQDFFGQLGNFVEELVEPDAPPRRTPERPRPPAEMPPQPQERPVEQAEPAESVEEPPPLPQRRPEAADVPEPAVEAAPDVAAPVADELSESEVEARVYQAACPAVLLGLVEAEATPPLSEDQCGERSPLTVTAVLANGRMVPLSSPITTNCAMASALPAWVGAVDGYASAALDSPLAEISTGTSYMCRKRNNAEAGFTSEHGFANAVDVSGFTLEDGRSIGVEANWLPAMAPEGRLLRFAHGAGCTGFTTVLGPEANAEHEDHLHLDLGCHGQSCTARICE